MQTNALPQNIYNPGPAESPLPSSSKSWFSVLFAALFLFETQLLHFDDKFSFMRKTKRSMKSDISLSVSEDRWNYSGSAFLDLAGSARKKIIKNDVYNNFIVIFAFEIVNTFSLNTRDESWKEASVFGLFSWIRAGRYGWKYFIKNKNQSFKNCAYDRITEWTPLCDDFFNLFKNPHP